MEEFIEREPSKKEDHPRFQLPIRNKLIEDESSKKYFDDLENQLESQEIRRYKDEAKAALDKRTLARTADLESTMDRWLEENKLRAAMRDGIWKPEKKDPPLDYTKIGVTAGWQVGSLIFALLCIINGAWPVTLVTVPIMFALNLLWLLDREGK